MSQLTFLYGKVDMVPPPPEALIKQAFELKELAKQGKFASDTFRDTPHRPSLRTLIKDGKEYQNAFTNTVIAAEHQEWAEEHIGQKCNDIRISLTTVGNSKNGPHIDITRSYSFIYLLDHGGEEHETCFYREKNHNSMFRPLGHYVNNYDDLELVAKTNFPLNRWFLINAGVLHSIENIPNGRLSIQMSFAGLPNFKFIDPVYTASE